MKKILILGGAKAQMQLIQAAKELGYYVVLCDYTTTNPGIALADKHYQVSTLDLDAVMEVAQKEKIDGVISNSEPAMLNVARVAEKLGLVGNPPAAVECLLSKAKFREAQKRVGIYSPKFVQLSSFEHFYASIREFMYPIIIKPSENSGTRGTTCIYNGMPLEEIRKAFDECKQISRNELVTVEEYVEMPSLTVIEGDLFIHNGDILWNGLFFTKRSEFASMIPMTDIFPLDIPEGAFKIIKEQLSELLSKIGIKHGEYNAEMYFTTKKELFVIEINPRQGGNGIPEFIFKCSGVDMSKLLVATAMKEGQKCFDWAKQMKDRSKYMARHIVFPRKSGAYGGLCISDEIKQYVKNVDVCVDIGTTVRNAKNAADNLAFIDLEFGDKNQQMKFCEKIEQYIYPVIEDNTAHKCTEKYRGGVPRNSIFALCGASVRIRRCAA